MNWKTSKKFGTGVIILLVTVCFIPAMAGAFAPGDGRQDRGFDGKGHHRSALGIWRNPQLVQKLGLTSEQVKKIRDADFSFGEKRLALKAQLDSLRLQMDKSFSDDVIDDKAVVTLAKKISDIKGKLLVQKVESRLALGKILTANQIKKLNLYDMQPKRKRPGQGRERKMKAFLMEKPCDEKPFEN